MAQELEKCAVNNTSALENITCIKQEFQDDNYIENQIFVAEAKVNTNTIEIKEYITSDEIEEYESSVVDNIKREIPLSEVYKNIANDDVKIEYGINTADIKTEFDNKQLCKYICATLLKLLSVKTNFP